MARLGDVGAIITGNTPKTSDNRNYSSDDICFIKPSDIDDNELTNLCDSEYYISEYARSKARILPAYSVLVTCIGIVGKVGINVSECAFNQQINAIIPDTQKCTCRYLAYAIQHAKPKLQSVANAPVVPILNKSQFSDIEIPLPSLVEQRKIAAVLDKVSDLIDKRHQQLDKLDLLVKSKFVEMFGDCYTNPYNLPILKWSDVFNTTTGKLDSNAAAENEKYPFFTCSKEILRIDAWAFDQEALLLAGNNAAGKYDVKYYKGKFNAYQRTYVLSLKKNWSYSLFRFQLEDKLKYLEQQSLGGLTKYLTLKILNELEFIIPSSEEQNEFADFVEQVEKSKATIQQSLAKLETLKKALMQEYFG